MLMSDMSRRQSLVVYSRPSCIRCKRVMRRLDRARVRYVKVNVDMDDDAYNRLQTYGFSSLPVLEIVDGDSTGFLSVDQAIDRYGYTSHDPGDDIA